MRFRSFVAFAVEPALSQLILPRGWTAEVIRTPSSNYTQLSSDKVVITAVTPRRGGHSCRAVPLQEDASAGRVSSSCRFLEETRPEPDASDKLYALLVYGGPHKAPLPTIASVVFPDERGNILTDDVNLILDHDDVVRRYTHKEQPTTTELTLRRKPKSGTQEG